MDIYLELVSRLENVGKYNLRNGPVEAILYDFARKYDIKDGKMLNDLAERLATFGAGRSQGTPIELTPQTLVDAEILKEELAPLIREIRSKVFHAEEAPFGDRTSAMKWLSSHSLNAEQIQSIEKAKDHTHYFQVIEGKLFVETTPPAILAKLTEEIADGTSVSHSSLIMHILANTGLICPSFKLKTSASSKQLPSGSEVVMKTIEIAFQDTLSYRDMGRVYRYVKSDFGLRRSRKVKKEHLELFLLVRERGIPQETSKTTFWTDIMEEWNRKHLKHKYNTWKAVNMAYNRIVKHRKERLESGLPTFGGEDVQIRVTSMTKRAEGAEPPRADCREAQNER